MQMNVVLFDDFETLDAFGPVEVFGYVKDLELHYVSLDGGVVTSVHGVPVDTVPFGSVENSDITLIPGGRGTRSLAKDSLYLAALTKLVEESKWCLTVCTGSGLLAATPLLDGKRATTNKRAFAWPESVNGKVDWVRSARWVVDGKYYTSSGVSAGMDMALGFVADQFGADVAKGIATGIEYIWNDDAENDPFAI